MSARPYRNGATGSGSDPGLCASQPRRGETKDDVLSFEAMSPLRAHVLNGRIVVDEPTDLPEGTELYLQPMNDIDHMDAEERAALEESIEEGYADFERGDHEDALAFSKELLKRQ